MKNLEAPYDARAVSNLLLKFAQSRGVSLTQVSLLKILYFAHGWYLSTYRQPLIKQYFEAWKYGPVVKVVRDAFKHFGKQPITGFATTHDLVLDEIKIVEPDLNLLDTEFVRKIFEFYFIYDAWELSAMTHESGSPWDKLWNADGEVGRFGMRIKNGDIQAHFDRLPRRIGVN